MKILIVSPRLPDPIGKADSMTVYRIVEYFSKRHDVYLATFAEKPAKPGQVERLRELCKAVEVVPIKKWKAGLHIVSGLLQGQPLQVSYHKDGEMSQVVGRMIAQHDPDLLYAHLIRTGEFIRDVNDRPKVLAMQISQTLNYRRMIEHIRLPLYKLLYSVEYALIRRYEPAITRHFTSCLLISENDLQAIDGNEQIHNVFYSPHGVDYAYYTRNPETIYEENAILFCGVLETPTNLDAVLYFYQQIYPLVKKEVPDVKLYLLGRRPPEQIRSIAASDTSVVVPGFVEDIRPYYAKVRVGIDPVRIGAGLQNKLLVGMSMEQAMVSTSVANEGIGAADGEHLLIADTPEDFARATVRLLRDPAGARQMGQSARKFIEDKWSWEYYFGQLEEHFEDLVSRGAGTPAPVASQSR